MREVRDPVGAQEASALRKAEREAQAQDDSGPKENASETLRRAASQHLGHDIPPGGGVDRESLEFDVVLQLVSFLARSSPGKAAVQDILPAFDEPAVRRSIEETAEITRFRVDHGRLPLAGVEEIGPLLDALESSGGSAAPSDFSGVLAAARAASAVRSELAKVQSPHLAGRRGRLPDFEDLLRSSRRLFDKDGAVRDDASPSLAEIRSRLRRRRGQVTRQLQKLLGTHKNALGDSVIVLRNDRYCLPVAASARARVPGIVHDRSGSGQTVFVEPIEIIESNNELALLVAEERHEVERLIREFGLQVLGRGADLRKAVAELADLDRLEAKVEFGEQCGGRLADLSDNGDWTLRQARHPLLDPGLAPLRRRVLGEEREARPIVALDLELSRQKRMLVVSGPNAGGKTVVLKTAGLFSLMTQSGIPVPAGPGTRLPVFSAIRTEIGDAQAILSDRSTFSSSVETLSSVLSEAGAGTLALIDEIGGATDPEEGSALACAWLEEFLARGGRAIVTTHLSAIKRFAAGRTDSLCAAMEFDERTGRPNYRLHPGLSGRSRALSVAREHGLPESVVQRAESILGEAWKSRQEQESEAEQTIERLRESERKLEAERGRTQEEAERLTSERERLADERRRSTQEGLAKFENARRELTREVAREIAAIRRDSAYRASDSSDAIVAAAGQDALRQAGLDDIRQEPDAGVLRVGGRARWRGGKTEGVVITLEKEEAWIEVAGKRLRVLTSDLEPVASPAREQASSNQSRVPSPPSPDAAGVLTREVNVIGRRLDEAIVEVEKSLDDAIVAGAGRLRVVHGHGTGRLRDGLRDHFRQYPGVASLYPADAREGGNGATIVELE